MPTKPIAMVAESWLGTGYQVTSQLNVVNPGGEAAVGASRLSHGLPDFEGDRALSRPAHRLSPVLTLQGAVAHVDMPVETGPDALPSLFAKLRPGFFAWRKARV